MTNFKTIPQDPGWCAEIDSEEVFNKAPWQSKSRHLSGLPGARTHADHTVNSRTVSCGWRNPTI